MRRCFVSCPVQARKTRVGDPHSSPALTIHLLTWSYGFSFRFSVSQCPSANKKGKGEPVSGSPTPNMPEVGEIRQFLLPSQRFWSRHDDIFILMFIHNALKKIRTMISMMRTLRNDMDDDVGEDDHKKKVGYLDEGKMGRSGCILTSVAGCHCL